MPRITKADQILNQVYTTLNLTNTTDLQKYNQITNIVNEIQNINAINTIPVKTTGTISERLCELGIKSVLSNRYTTLPNKWQWLGDFLLLGMPTNIVLSVKSFTVKERLLASGSGSMLYPTIAWGLFNDVNEWSKERLMSYLYRGFYVIYVPDSFYPILAGTHPDSLNILNVNGNPLIRKHSDFTNDLTIWKASIVDPNLGEFIDIKLI